MHIEINVHGKTIEESKKMIQKAIIQNPKCSKVVVIHGYNNGNAIQKFLENKSNIQSKRVIETRKDFTNSGITHIYLKIDL